MPKNQKNEIIKRREEIKDKLSEFIKENNLGFSFADIEKMIFEESGQKDLQKIFSLFFEDMPSRDANEINRLLELVNDAWNYFPHKSLEGMCPKEKAQTRVVSDSVDPRKDLDELWGDGGPYSEVKLIEETRILEDQVSRRFFTVEAVVNPFTYKLCLKNKKSFKGDQIILEFLEYAENRGFEDGYVAMAFNEEFTGDETLKRAFAHKEYAEGAIIRMHKFAMKELGIPESPAFKMKIKK